MPSWLSHPTATPIIAGIFAVFVAILAAVTSYLTARYTFDAKMVEIGISLLSADPSKTDISPARSWAIKLVSEHSGHSFDENEMGELLHHPILLSGVSYMSQALSGVSEMLIDCSDYERQSDGSWLRKINSEKLNGNIPSGTRMALALDYTCVPVLAKPLSHVQLGLPGNK